MSSTTAPEGSGFPRLVWALVGPMVLLVTAFLIFEKGGGWLGPSSIVYLVVLAATLLARWIDYRSGQSETASGEPTTPALIRRYYLTVPSIAALVWIAAHVIGQR